MALARSLNLRVVAEGVETLTQLEQLADLGADVAQGYLFSQPVAAAEAIAMIDRSWCFRLS